MEDVTESGDRPLRQSFYLVISLFNSSPLAIVKSASRMSSPDGNVRRGDTGKPTSHFLDASSYIIIFLMQERKRVDRVVSLLILTTHQYSPSPFNQPRNGVYLHCRLTRLTRLVSCFIFTKIFTLNAYNTNQSPDSRAPFQKSQQFPWPLRF